MRRLLTAALVLGATATTATAEQFIAAFSSNAHPAQIEVAMTQMDGNGQTLDATGLAVAPTEPNQSIAAVPMMPGAVNACVTMAPAKPGRGRSRADPVSRPVPTVPDAPRSRGPGRNR